MAMSFAKQVILAGLILAALWIVGGLILQTEGISQVARQSQKLQDNLDSFRQTLLPVDSTQREIDSAASHLKSTDPDDAVTSFEKRITDAEQRTAIQQGKNNAADMKERLDGIRKRQQDLRDRLGDVITERRALDPVFNEIKERQRQADNSLADLEVDDNRNSLALKLEETEKAAIKSQNRLQALQSAFETFRRLNAEFGAVQKGLLPLQSNLSGVIALADEAQSLRDNLVKALNEIDPAKLSARIDEYTKSKTDLSQKVDTLGNSSQTLEILRREFAALKERHDHIERAIAEIETNPAGERLDQRMKMLGEQSIQSQSRLWALQEKLVTLEKFKTEVEKMQTEMIPLRAADTGIDAMNGQVQALLDRLVGMVSALEQNQGVTLVSRLESLSNGKTQTKARIGQLQECFTGLSTIRTDINGLFATMDESLKKHL